MSKFVYVYTGESGDDDEDAMAAWMGWFGALGDSVVDMGAPLGASRAVSSSSVKEGAPTALTGYTIIEASDLDEAVEKAKGCPVIAAGGNVEVYEYIQMG